MQLILLEDVKKLGQFGDLVAVRGGYARNYLLPMGKALPASASNLERFEAEKAKLKLILDDQLLAAKTRATEITATQLSFTVNASDEGKLYGSIGTADISRAFKEKGLEVKRQEIRLPTGPIRELGDFEIDIQPHAEVTCTVKITVLSDKE